MLLIPNRCIDCSIELNDKIFGYCEKCMKKRKGKLHVNSR